MNVFFIINDFINWLTANTIKRTINKSEETIIFIVYYSQYAQYIQ